MNKQDREFIELLIERVAVKFDGYVSVQKWINWFIFAALTLNLFGSEKGVFILTRIMSMLGFNDGANVISKLMGIS